MSSEIVSKDNERIRAYVESVKISEQMESMAEAFKKAVEDNDDRVALMRADALIIDNALYEDEVDKAGGYSPQNLDSAQKRNAFAKYLASLSADEKIEIASGICAKLSEMQHPKGLK